MEEVNQESEFRQRRLSVKEKQELPERRHLLTRFPSPSDKKLVRTVSFCLLKTFLEIVESPSLTNIICQQKEKTREHKNFKILRSSHWLVCFHVTTRLCSDWLKQSELREDHTRSLLSLFNAPSSVNYSPNF